MNHVYETVVVGAGFAGLSCAAHLAGHGKRDLAVLEQGGGVGAFWRGNYDRIRLHTPFHDLPSDGGLRDRYEMFLPRDRLIDYFEAYASHHRLAPYLQFDTQVETIARERESWQIDTNRGPLRARILVIATSYNRKPMMPDIAGLNDYRGKALHSRDYKNAEPFVGKSVLVVGSGNSGAEIALDLYEGGAQSVSLLIRGPRHFIALHEMGEAARLARARGIELTPDHLLEAHAYTRSHPDFRAKLKEKDRFFLQFSIDMSSYGIQPPDEGPATEIALRGRVPVMDQGTADAIQEGHIRLIDAKKTPIRRITEDGVQLGDGAESFDALVFATGMEPGLDDLFDDAERYLYWNADMRRKMPNTDGRSRSIVEPSLYFPGFDLTANGGLSLGLWGAEVANTIAKG